MKKWNYAFNPVEYTSYVLHFVYNYYSKEFISFELAEAKTELDNIDFVKRISFISVILFKILNKSLEMFYKCIGLQLSNVGGVRCLLSFFVHTNCGDVKEFEKQCSFLRENYKWI